MTGTRLAGMALTVVLLTLTGCVPKQNTETGNPKMNEYEQVFQEEMEAFIVCMDNRDAEGMKALMSPGALEADEDIDAQIERLFQYYEGTSTMTTLVEALETGAVERVSKKRGVGTATRDVSEWFYLYTDKGTYICYATVRQLDKIDEMGEGIVSFALMTEEVLVVENTKFPAEAGVHVIEDLEGEYHIRKVGGYSHIFEEYDREIEVAVVESWLEENNSMSAFRSTFGEPNVDKGYRAIYELQKEDAERRFLSIFVDEGTDTIEDVYLLNEHNSVSLRRIYPIE